LLAPTSLNGTATGSTPLSVIWSTVSGPGSVAFSNSNSAATVATFHRLGNYVLRLTASNLAGTASRRGRHRELSSRSLSGRFYRLLR
jgi:hypothetical protein